MFPFHMSPSLVILISLSFISMRPFSSNLFSCLGKTCSGVFPNFCLNSSLSTGNRRYSLVIVRLIMSSGVDSESLLIGSLPALTVALYSFMSSRLEYENLCRYPIKHPAPVVSMPPQGHPFRHDSLKCHSTREKRSCPTAV